MMNRIVIYDSRKVPANEGKCSGLRIFFSCRLAMFTTPAGTFPPYAGKIDRRMERRLSSRYIMMRNIPDIHYIL